VPLTGIGNPKTAACSTASLGVGTHTKLKATYSGDAGNLASTSNLYTQTINPALTPTVTTLGSDINPSNQGQTFRLTAQITGASPTGTVSFVIDGVGVTGCGNSPVTGGGNVRSAICDTSLSLPGGHGVVATYSGDGNNATSSSATFTQNVNGTLPAGIPNGSFETPKMLGDYGYNPSAAPWTFSDSAGIAGFPNAFTESNPPAPDGAQVAFLQNVGGVSQVVALAAGRYVVSFFGAQRCNLHDGVQVVQVLIDGIEVGRFEPPADFIAPPPTVRCPYTSYATAPVMLGGGAHTLAFKGIGGSVYPDPFDPKHGFDYTAFIDDVDMVPVP
jgi:hypothetical protein